MTSISKQLYALVALLVLSVADSAATAVLQGRLRLPSDSPVNTTRITLNDGEHTTYSRLDGSFTFYNVEPGIHLLDVHSHTHAFSQIKIQLLEDSMDAPKCIEYVYPGAPKQVTTYPLIMTAHGTYEYFEKKSGFSIFALFKNPMLLMMLFSVGLMFFMPKLMEGLEPEEKERMRKQMEAQKDPTKFLSQMWGDLTGAEEAPPPKPSKSKRNKRE